MLSSGSCAGSPEPGWLVLSTRSILHLRLGKYGNEWGSSGGETAGEGPLADFCRRTTPHFEVHAGGAFLDLSGTVRLYGPGLDGAAHVSSLASNVGPVQAAGEAPTRLSARLASWYAARFGGGILAVRPDQVAAFLRPVPVRFLPGRKSIIDRLRQLGVRSLGDLQVIPRDLLRSVFGEAGGGMVEEAWGREWPPPGLREDGSPSYSSRFTLVAGVRLRCPLSEESVVTSLLRGLAVRALTQCPGGPVSRGRWRLTVFWPEGKSAHSSLKGGTHPGWNSWVGLLDLLWSRLQQRRKGLLGLELAAGPLGLPPLAQGHLFPADVSDRRLAEAVRLARHLSCKGLGTASEELSRARGAVWYGPGEGLAKGGRGLVDGGRSER